MSTPDKDQQLSVLLVTYNHSGYIQQALESLFGQRLDGPIELVIADDGSSDSTLERIREYEGRDPRFHFKYLDSTTNVGITKNYQRGFAACTGKYVAVLEGDDYWASPEKLHHQVDFLEAHWECALCSVNYFVYEEGRSQFTARTTAGQGYRLIGARELIHDNLVGNFSTCLYRKSALDNLPQGLFEIKSYDWIVNICVARQSLIGFLETPMSVYRLHSAGVWTQKSPVEKLREQLDLIPPYDALTEYVFHADFEVLTNNLRQAVSVTRLGHAAEGLATPVAAAAYGLQDYLPPVLISLAHAITPPVLKQLLYKIRHRSRVV